MTSMLFCVDFDETLFATDLLRADIATAIHTRFSSEVSKQYEAMYEETRTQGGISIPLVLQRLRVQQKITARQSVELAELFHTFPYQEYVYPGAEAALTHLKTLGKVILFSDGDEFFQAQKIYATSLAQMVGQVVVVPNKVEYFAQLEGFYPAERYVFVDDKARILDSARQYFGDSAITVHIRQGRYAEIEPEYPPTITLRSIAEIDTSFII